MARRKSFCACSNRVCEKSWLYLNTGIYYEYHVIARYFLIQSNVHHGQVERWGAGVETQKNVRGEIGGWGRVPFNETYAPSLSTIYDGA